MCSPARVAEVLSFSRFVPRRASERCNFVLGARRRGVFFHRRVGLEELAAAAAASGLRYVRAPFPRELKRRARAANPGQLSRENTHSLHLLTRLDA